MTVDELPEYLKQGWKSGNSYETEPINRSR